MRPSSPGSGRVIATPRARGLARDLRRDLTEVRGSGPGGRIVAADVVQRSGGTSLRRTRSADAVAAARACDSVHTFSLSVDFVRARRAQLDHSVSGMTSWMAACAAAALTDRPMGRIGLLLERDGALVVAGVDVPDPTDVAAVDTNVKELLGSWEGSKLRPDALEPVDLVVNNIGPWGIDVVDPVASPMGPLVLTLGAANGTRDHLGNALLKLSFDLRRVTARQSAEVVRRARAMLESGPATPSP